MIRRAPELEALFDVPVRAMCGLEGAWRPMHPAEELVVAGVSNVRRAEFAAGRACAHAALASLAAPDGPLLPGPDRAPLWPAGFVGSITHARGACAAAVSTRIQAASLGLDVEPRMRLDDDLQRLVCLEEERRHHARLPAHGLDWAMLTFCGKEAFYKAYHPLTGQFLDFHDVRLCFASESVEGGVFRVALTRPDLPKADRLDHLVGRWRCDAGHLWTAFTWPARHL